MAKEKSKRKNSNNHVIDMEKARQERQKKKTPKKTTKKKQPRIVLVIVLLVIVLVVIGVSFRLFSLNSDTEKAQARLEALEKEKIALEEELIKINDPKYIEQKARDELQMITPNETLYVIEEEKDKNKDN